MSRARAATTAVPGVARPAVAVALAMAAWASAPCAGAAPGDAGPVAPGVGLPCTHDRACPGYLRCAAGACAAPPAVAGTGGPDAPRVVFDLPDGRTATYKVELADDPYERERGLMFRDRMAAGWGMLFLFPGEDLHRFWMKNTFIPLDMVFLGDDGTVRGVVERARPQDPTGRGVDRPSRDVLELAGGEAASVGIRAGVRYRYVGVPSIDGARRVAPTPPAPTPP